MKKSDESSSTFGFISFGITVILLVLVGIVVVSHIADTSNDLQYDTLGLSSTDNFTATSLVKTLTTIDQGITSQTIQVYNDTYLSCDGINYYLRITPSSNDTLSFWYKNTTSQWIHVVNVMGTKYTNSVEANPHEYPVYWDGTYYYFCKTDATTFWEGSIDDVRGYDGGLTQGGIDEVYSGGRA
jgi:hypothetical protein